MALFLLAAAGLVATAGLGAACLRLPFVASLLAANLLAAAEIVVLTEALSLAHAVGARGYLAAEAILLAGAAGAWLARGRPRPPLPRLAPRALLRDPVLTGLALVVLAALAYQAFVAVASAPNNWDALTYHLSRAAGWYQHGAVEYLGAHTQRENAFPPNGEIEILYTFVFLGRDALAALPQLLAELGLLAAVYGSARRLDFARRPALLASLLTGTLSEVALEATSTQNDLVVTSFVAAAAFFVLGRMRRELPLAGLAIGVAVGAKLTALFALPILLLLAVRALPRRHLAELCACTAVAFATVGAYGYALNGIETSHALGVVPEADSYRPEVTARGTVSTVARIYYRFADLSGYQPDIRWLMTMDRAGQFAFRRLAIAPDPPESSATSFRFFPNTQANEDFSYFGPLGAFLILPLSFGFLAAWAFRRTDGIRGVLALALPLYVLELAIAYRYDAWIGRFMLIPVALTMPLAAWLYPMRLLAAVAALTGAVTLSFAHAHNHLKPAGLDGSTPVWAMSRSAAQSLVRPEMTSTLAWIDRRVPDDASVGVALAVNDWDYPLYGPSLARRLVALPPGETPPGNLRFAIFGSGVARPPRAAGWRAVRFPQSGWTVYVRRATAQSESPSGSSIRSSGRRSGTSRS